MKIIFVDDVIQGHHEKYLSQLSGIAGLECIAILPKSVDCFDGKIYVQPAPDTAVKRSAKEYLQWLKLIYRIVQAENPDIVHFLDGDYFYRFFGMGLRKFNTYHSILTLHWERAGLLQKLSLKQISRSVNQVVVHSDYICKHLLSYGIQNVTHIEYPQLLPDIERDTEEARVWWGLKKHTPVIACIGNTRQDKGLDILLEALQQVKKPFQLLIAGKEEAFNQNYIAKATVQYADSVICALHYLSDEELKNAINAADIIALPYKKTFNGASGPLGEGVCCGKCIVGANHGNLGNTITQNHLGYVFETENPTSLASVLTQALSSPFIPDNIYLNYQKALDPVFFANRYADVYKSAVQQNV